MRSVGIFTQVFAVKICVRVFITLKNYKGD